MKTIKNGTLEYEAAGNIGCPHCFTTRLGGVSTGVMTGLNIAIKDGETKENVRKNLEILGDALGFEISDIVLTRQIHSDIVRVVNRDDCSGYIHRDYPECDALVTNDPGVTLMVFTADCTPVLLWDSVTGAVGAAHAGWRGTAAKIAVKTLNAMVEQLGCDVKNIRAAIGPNIAACHFETDADVPEAIVSAYGEKALEFIRKKGEKYFPDLKAINALGLREAGVRSIERSDSCTACAPHRFWSHRVTAGKRGSQGAVILCQEVIR